MQEAEAVDCWHSDRHDRQVGEAAVVQGEATACESGQFGAEESVWLYGSSVLSMRMAGRKYQAMCWQKEKLALPMDGQYVGRLDRHRSRQMDLEVCGERLVARRSLAANRMQKLKEL
jgi:hypothetical protein